MVKKFDIKVDLDPVLKRVTRGGQEGVRKAANHVLTEANKHAPHDEGTLERSGTASVDAAAGVGAVSYDTPYAVRQHEDMSLHHDGKGSAKWLENTLAAERETVAQIVATAMRKEMGT